LHFAKCEELPRGDRPVGERSAGANVKKVRKVEAG
jgi:hypothetical protein